MASTPPFFLIPLGLCFLVLLNGCSAQMGGGFRQGQQQQSQQQHRLQGRQECRFDRITAREPNRQVRSEAGEAFFWDSGNNDELDCAGVEVVRHEIEPRGLLLPYYSNAPQLVYIIQGQGLQGHVLPGCPETFETPMEGEFQGQERGQGQGRRGGQFFDRHQRVYRYRQGDVLALPAGVVHWTYNDGDTPLISVTVRDTSNFANQLDRTFRKFFLAGNPEFEHVQQGGEQGGRRSQRQEGSQGRHGEQGRGGQEEQANNIFSGFDEKILQDVFQIDSETVRQLRAENDNRGAIVRAEKFQVVSPQYQEGEQEEFEEYGQRRRRGGRGGRDDNGLEQTLCSATLRANIAHPSRADFYNPRGGRITNLNSFKFPVLNLVQLSAERGVLYQNAILAPHYNLNAHSVIYITRGSSRMQIVKNDGTPVFDDEVREGQLVVVPQNFAVLKRANEEGCEWVAFKTNENAMTTQLAGRFSAIRSLPEDVLVNSYGISRDQAQSLKFNRQEGLVFSPSSRSRSRRGSRERGGGRGMSDALKPLLNVLFN